MKLNISPSSTSWAWIGSFVWIVAIVLTAPFHAQQAGAVRGTVFDEDFDVPVEGVRVTLIEVQLSAESGADGTFVIEAVPAGEYTVVFAKSGYERKVLTDKIVTPATLADLGIVKIATEVVELPPMIVTGEDILADNDLALIEVRQEATNVMDGISLDEIKKAGESDVAGALTKVTGTSVRDGKFATVRGLSDRYTGTTLNGVRLPSADPRVRAVQVDLFPTGTVDAVSVSKTFTPNLQGDFTGGGIDIQTKSIPDSKIVSLSYSREYDTISTFNRDFLRYKGGGVTGDAQAGSKRFIPRAATGAFPPLSQAAFSPTPQQIADAQELDRITRSFDSVIGVRRGAPAENESLALVLGNSFSLGGEAKIGILGALTHRKKYSFYEDGFNNQGVVSSAGQFIEVIRPRRDNQGTQELLIGGLLSTVFQINDQHQISLRTVVNRGAEDRARMQIESVSETTIERNQTLQYIERDMQSQQLSGEHAFGFIPMLGDPVEKLSLDWFYADNSTSQIEPDVRFFRNVFDSVTASGRVPPNSTDAQNSRRIYRDIEEDNEQYAFNVSVPFTQWSQKEGRVRLGIYSEESLRGYTQESFTYTFPGQLGSFLNPVWRDNLLKSQFVQDPDLPDQIWTDVFLNSDNIGLTGPACVPPATPFFGACAAANQLLWTITPLGNDVNYVGDQQIDATYWMVELPLTRKIELIVGARKESTKIDVVPENLRFGRVERIEQTATGDRFIVAVPQAEAVANIDEDNTLPSISVNWKLSDKRDMSIRAAWSETVARPTFRELAPVATEEFIFGDEFLGNPELELSEIENFDLRWEWFRRPGELFSVSVFEKTITDPIELISFATGNRSFVQPVNFERGEVSGIEIEARTTLDWISESLTGLAVGFNYTVLDTAVDVPEVEQISLASFGLDDPTRRLQGQPDSLLNINLNWEDSGRGLSAGLSFNRIGETLSTGAARGIEDGNPNVFEDPYDTLNLFMNKTVEARPGRPAISFTLRAKNLLQPDRSTSYQVRNQVSEIKALRRTPMRFSLGATFSF